MAQDINIQILGVKEINQILNELPHKVRRKHILATWRRSSKPMIRSAKSNIQSYSKSLAASIGNITGRSKKYPTIYVGPRAKGKHKAIAWIAPFVEFGTSGIKRSRKQGFKRDNANPAFGWVAKIKPGGQYRAPQAARPFMRPAINQTIEQVKNNFYIEIKTVFQKTVNKYNKRRAI